MRHLTLLPLVALLVACNGPQSETGDTGPAMQFGRTDTCDTADDGSAILLTTPDQPQGVSILQCAEDDAGDYCVDFTTYTVVELDGLWTIEAGRASCGDGIYYLISYW